MLGLREALRSPAGADLLITVGTLMEALPGGIGPDSRAGAAVTFAQFVETLFEVDVAETTAVLHVVRAFTHDDKLRARIDRQLPRRGQPMPPAVTGLAGIRATGGWLLSDALRDVDSVVLAIEGPRGTPRSLVVQVHHDAAAITDAFVTDDTADEVRQDFADAFERDDVDGVIVSLSAADVRAHVERLLELGAGMPTPDTGTWPECRPFLWYLCRGLPTGGRGYRTDDLGDDELAAIVDQLLTSDAARRAGVDPARDSTDRDIVESMVVFAATAGLVEPWRWSPRRVSEFTLSWLPMVEPDDLRRPDRVLSLLRMVVAEAGRHEQLPRRQIAETTRAIDRVAADFRRLAADVVATLPAPNEYDDEFDEFDDEHDDEYDDEAGATSERPSREELLGPRIADLETIVGGPEALAAIDVKDIAPLSLAPVDLERLPERVRDLVTQIDRLAVDAIDALADPRVREEFSAAVRVLLTHVAQRAPASVRRAKPAMTAAALCWAVGRANDLVGERRERELWQVVMGIGQPLPEAAYQPSTVPVKSLMRHLGVSSVPSIRAAALLEAAGYRPALLAEDRYALGEAGLLTANKRLRVALERDLWLRKRTDEPAE